MSDHVLARLCAGVIGIAVVALAWISMAAQTWTPALTPDGQPDLQGVWSDTSATPLERPKALEGRALLTDTEVARLQARADRLFKNGSNDFVTGDNLFLAALADLETVQSPNATGSALNMVQREFDNRTSLITDPPDGRIPPVTPEGQRRQAANQAATLAIPWQPGQNPSAALRRLPAGPEDLSNLLRCISWGVPKIAGNFNYGSHYQILQGPGYVVLLSEVNHEARIIPLNGRPHLPQTIRQVYGDPRGRWEGNTLVVDTTNFSPKSYFMGSAEHLHLIERFTRISADTINYEIAVDDPTTWTKPWRAMIRLRRTEDSLYESACHEGNHHVIRGILAAARSEEKSAAEAGTEPK
jgi:hypothetical protein